MKIRIERRDEIAMEIKVRENERGNLPRIGNPGSLATLSKQKTGRRRKRENKTYIARRASGITFFRYAQNRKIAKPNTVFGAIKPKCLIRIAKTTT